MPLTIWKDWFKSSTESAYAKARDAIACRLTQNRGEHIIRLGASPSRAKIFDIDGKESLNEPLGTACTTEELKSMKSALIRTAEELGAKVGFAVDALASILIFFSTKLKGLYPVFFQFTCRVPRETAPCKCQSYT